MDTATGHGIAIVGSSFGKRSRRVFGHVSLLGTKVHGANALFEPVGVEPELLKQLHEPVTRHGIAPFGIRNTGLADVQYFGQLNLGAAVGGQFDALVYLCKTGHNSSTPSVDVTHASTLLNEQWRFVRKHQLTVLF